MIDIDTLAFLELDREEWEDDRVEAIFSEIGHSATREKSTLWIEAHSSVEEDISDDLPIGDS